MIYLTQIALGKYSVNDLGMSSHCVSPNSCNNFVLIMNLFICYNDYDLGLLTLFILNHFTIHFINENYFNYAVVV